MDTDKKHRTSRKGKKRIKTGEGSPVFILSMVFFSMGGRKSGKGEINRRRRGKLIGAGGEAPVGNHILAGELFKALAGRVFIALVGFR
jgi:hypothetical protein